MQRALGDLVVLDGLLGDSNEQLQIRLSWISSDDLPRARAALEQQKGFKENAVKNALLAAYGIVGDQFKEHLAPGLAPKKKVHLMVADANISMPLEGDAERCFEGLVHRAFEVLAPRHPQFTKQPTPARLRSVLTVLQELVQNDGQRMVLDKSKADEVRSIAAVKHFEMVRMNENEVVFAEGMLQHLGKAVASKKNLSVGAVKAAIDPNGLMRLDEQLKDFVVLAFAETSNPPLQLMRLGEPVLEPKLGSLEDAYSLVAVELPSQVEWGKALDVAGVLGITLGGRALSPAKMDALAEQVKAKAATLENAGMAELVSSHAQWCIRLGIDDDANQTPRGNVLSLLQDLVQRVDVGTSFEVAQALASFEWDAKHTTALTHMASSDRIKALLKELQNQSNVDAVDKSKALQNEGNVREVLDALREALRSDENLIQLRPALTDANQAIINALFKKSEETKPAPVEPIRGDPAAGEPSSAGDISVHEPAIAQAMPDSANATTTILASAKEVKSAVAEIEALVRAGKRVRLTYEVVEDGENGQ
ncbi:MAG: hypothetical protein GY822_00045 [Deltaproteobacteria bacterium]|nr:hypothetical protein [Deltaproteobacteria bacterium]